MNRDQSFAMSDSGAVTVDWVVLTAGITDLGLAAMSVVSVGVQDGAEDIASFTSDTPLIKTYFGLQTVNGSFEDVDGMIAAGYGFRAMTVNGWVDLNSQQLEVVDSG